MYEDKALKKLTKQQQAAYRRRELQIDSFIVAALKQAEGREYFYWLLEICKIGANPFTANALTTAFSCGEYNVGQQVLARVMEVAPALYLKMLEEKEEERKNAARSSSDTTGDDSSDDTAGPDSAND